MILLLLINHQVYQFSLEQKYKNDLISILKSHDNYEDSYLVHRLDKGTSGLMIIGKNYKTASDLGKLFINKNVFQILLCTTRWYHE